MLHFKTISSLINHYGLPSNRHPLFYMIQPTKEQVETSHASLAGQAFKLGFYCISLKKVVGGNVHYGRTKYDFDKGALILISPGQEISLENIRYKDKCFCILIHPDFLYGTKLGRAIKKFPFFDYTVNEALHLSDDEEEKMQKLYASIESEYAGNMDEFSKNIIISNLEVLLQYINRFYKRQFLVREEMNAKIANKFNALLRDYLADNRLETEGVPSLKWIASQIGLSKRYLSDTIKKETGKSAKDNLNLFLMDQAKNFLLQPGMTISGTAYKLGFEYPEYFSRLFKKKTGMSPTAFIETHSEN